jgi:hypothetical protein
MESPICHPPAIITMCLQSLPIITDPTVTIDPSLRYPHTFLYNNLPLPYIQPQLSTVIPIGGSAVAPTSQPQPFSVWNPGYEQCRLPSPSTITTRPERPITLDLHPSVSSFLLRRLFVSCLIQASTPLTPAESGISTAGSSYVSLPSADRLPTLLDSAPPAAVPIYERIQRTPPLVPPRSRRPTTEDGDLPRLSPVQHSPPYDHL